MSSYLETGEACRPQRLGDPVRVTDDDKGEPVQIHQRRVRSRR